MQTRNQVLSMAFFKLLIAITALLAVAMIARPHTAGAQTTAPATTTAAVDKAAIVALTQQLTALTAALQQQGKTAPTAAAPKVVIPKEGTLQEQVRELQAEVALLKQAEIDRNGGAPSPVYIGGFIRGATELTARQKEEVGAIVGLIRKEKPSKVAVIGYASHGGDADKNKELAGKRAEVVKKYIDQLLATQPARVAGAAAPAPVAPVVDPDDVETYVGGSDGQTGMFSHRLGPNGLNQAVVVKLVP